MGRDFLLDPTPHGTVGYCNFYEGESRKRLNYGSYDDGVRDQLRRIEHVIAPTIAGSGRRLFGDTASLQRMELIDVARTEVGLVLAGYCNMRVGDRSRG